MTFDASTSDVADPVPPVGPWIRSLSDGAVSVAAEGNSLVLRASDHLQQQYESLLARRKAGTLTANEQSEFDAICELDEVLSWLNRLARMAAACFGSVAAISTTDIIHLPKTL